MTKAIELNNISKSFGSGFALQNVSMSVDSGEIRGFLGPNGSGKSTTMKIIMGIIRPDSGSIQVMGMDMSQKTIEARKIIGYVPETPPLYEYLTIAEYLDFVGTAYGVDPKDRKVRVQDLLEALDLSTHLNELISSFSQGMKQKVALIAAILHRPKVLVLDEPLNGLDPKSARIVKDIISRLAKEGECAVLLSTHVLEIAESICDRLTIINHGSILMEGPIDQLRSAVGLNKATLEEIFLKLTAGEDCKEIVEALKL
jgi:ABC-2 type transport system ATP-binding protein